MQPFNRSYLDEAAHFFADTDLEIDPDATLFYCFRQDPAFWLWMGNELQLLLAQSHAARSFDDRPRIDRFLHGIIACDQLLGRQGTVITAMVQVLGHSTEQLEGLLKAPVLDLRKNLQDVGPHSGFTSVRLVHYARDVLQPADYGLFLRAFSLEGAEHAALRLTAELSANGADKNADGYTVEIKRQALYLTILNAVNQASQVGEAPVLAADLLSDPFIQALGGSEVLDWPEWQLLPLLTGGHERGVSLGIDFESVVLKSPLDQPESHISHLMLNGYHVARSDALQAFLEASVLPSEDPKGLVADILKKGYYGLAPSTYDWARHYLEAHREEFLNTPVKDSKVLEGFLRLGIDKMLVLNHPQFDNKAKGNYLGDQLGL